MVRTNRMVAVGSEVGDIRRLAESFEIALSARNLSPRTSCTYLDAVGLFAEFLERSGMPTRLDAITREHVEAFIATDNTHLAHPFAWKKGVRFYQRLKDKLAARPASPLPEAA